MARPRKETDLKALALKRYDLLVSRKAEIDEELKGLNEYLKAVGETGTKDRAVRKTTGQLPYERRVVSRQGRKTSATQAILSLISKSEKGISINEIMKQTGLLRKTVNGVLNRLKKERKIKAVKRGVYVKLNSTGQGGAQRKGQTRKAEPVAASAGVPKGAPKAKPKAPAKKARASKPQKKLSATGVIVSLIGKSEKGIPIDQILKQTGLQRNTVNGVLTRMKKAGKVKSAGRGVYVKA